jgi:hypothetical protein
MNNIKTEIDNHYNFRKKICDLYEYDPKEKGSIVNATRNIMSFLQDNKEEILSWSGVFAAHSYQTYPPSGPCGACPYGIVLYVDKKCDKKYSSCFDYNGVTFTVKITDKSIWEYDKKMHSRDNWIHEDKLYEVKS